MKNTFMKLDRCPQRLSISIFEEHHLALVHVKTSVKEELKALGVAWAISEAFIG
jgi:hypothetical protein